MARSEFAKDLEQLINRHSMENGSNTPDFILAEFMMNALQSYERAIYQRTSWHGNQVCKADPFVSSDPPKEKP